MRRQGSGRIINIASRSGMIGEAGCTLYNTAKFAVVGLSEGLAEELGDFGIQVMAACPAPSEPISATSAPKRSRKTS